MKKIHLYITYITCIILILALPPANVFATANADAAAAGAVTVKVDGKAVVFPDAKPFVDANNRVLAPLRPIAEAMGIDVSWHEPSQKAYFSESYSEANSLRINDLKYVGKPFYNDNIMVRFTIGADFIWCLRNWTVAGGPLPEEFYDISMDYTSDYMEMDTEAVIIDGRTYAPVRYLAEAFDRAVEWDDSTGTVSIERQKELSPSSAYDSNQKNVPIHETLFNEYMRLFEMMEYNVKGADFTNALLAYAADRTFPSHTVYGEWGPFEYIRIFCRKYRDVMKTASALYDESVVSLFSNAPTDLILYDYDVETRELRVAYADPPYYPCPLLFSYTEDENICELIVCTSLQYGNSGYFIEPNALDDKEFHDYIYPDVMSPDEYYADEGNYQVLMDDLILNYGYDEYLRSIKIDMRRVVDFFNAYPEKARKYKVTFVSDGSAYKLKDIMRVD